MVGNKARRGESCGDPLSSKTRPQESYFCCWGLRAAGHSWGQALDFLTSVFAHNNPVRVVCFIPPLCRWGKLSLRERRRSPRVMPLSGAELGFRGRNAEDHSTLRI